MRRTKILNAEEVRRTTYLEAQKAFHKHCRLKNLRPRTITYYTEDLDYFHAKTPVTYVDEITQDPYQIHPEVRRYLYRWNVLLSQSRVQHTSIHEYQQ